MYKMYKRFALLLSAILMAVLALVVLWTGFVGAQGPGEAVTGSGLGGEVAPSSASGVHFLAVSPVDCAVMGSPVAGYEISRGQDPNDVTDFLNALAADGFSVGTVDLSAGPIPPCVDVLIVQSLRQNNALLSSYTAADGAQLRTWAASGHGLMLAGDWGPFRAGTEELFLAYGYSQQGAVAVTDPTDFDPNGPGNEWVIYQGDNFVGHPILAGVASMELLSSSWLSPTANAIVTADADADPPAAPVMVAFTDGAGCVALSTDSNWFSVYDGGYFQQNNALAARQTVRWLNGCATLTLTKSAAPSPVQAGGVLTYTLTAVNHYTASVTGLVVTDAVPANATFVTATVPHAGPSASGVITWSPGSLAVDASASVTMVVQVDGGLVSGTLVVNNAWVTSDQGLTGTATAVTSVVTQAIQIVDPALTKAVSSDQAQPGDVVTFTLVVQQSPGSNGDATNVQIVDPLPVELDLLSVQATAGLTATAGQVVTWTLQTLAPTQVETMTIRTRINSNLIPPAVISNQATLSFDQGTDRSSNVAQVSVPGQAPTPELTPTPTPTLTPTPVPPPTATPEPPTPDTPTPLPPAPAPAPTATATAVVLFLPETGSRSQTGWPVTAWLVIGGVMLLTATMVRRGLGRGR